MAQRKLNIEGQVIFSDFGFWGQSLHISVWDQKNKIELQIKASHKSTWNFFKALGYSEDEIRRVRNAVPVTENLRGQKIIIMIESK